MLHFVDRKLSFLFLLIYSFTPLYFRGVLSLSNDGKYAEDGEGQRSTSLHKLPEASSYLGTYSYTGHLAE